LRKERKMDYRNHFSTLETPQSEAIPGKNQVKNSAGGYSFELDKWGRLDRFLVLGTEGGTYYVTQHDLTVENATNVLDCIKDNGVRVVDRIVEISVEGRAHKNDPALFALALCMGHGDTKTKKAAFAALSKVARIGTHLFHLLNYVEGFRGWGRGFRDAIQKWYLDKPIKQLAFQSVKYQQRDGWSHRDALRLAHPKPDCDSRNQIFHWITQGELSDTIGEDLRIIEGFEKIKEASDKDAVIGIIKEYNLPWECVPTVHLKSPDVWRALLPNLAMTAMIRNLGRMTANGFLKPMSDDVDYIVEQVRNEEKLTKARIHPISVLAALCTYEQGHGARGKLHWNPVGQIVDALNKAFYKTFKNVEPTGKRIMLAIDVSGSMTWGDVSGVPGLTPRKASAALALVTANVESKYMFLAFCDRLVKISISPTMRLDTVCNKMDRMSFGGTDCALPMIWAEKNKVDVDSFIVYTDSETWFGDVHPCQALESYRKKMGISAKLIVVGMVGNKFSIADPSDAGMIDIVGFDTATPNVIADFVR
jgi:60 kDa SS-A/Ro ribonucleoprotein